MGPLASFLRWLRTPPAALSAEPPSGPVTRGEGPYRRAAPAASSAPASLVDGIARFRDLPVLETFATDGAGYARYIVHPPGGPRCAVACFELPDDYDAFFAARFDDLRILTRLVRHPAVARVLELGQEDDLCWHLAAYPPGKTLRDVEAQVRYGAAAPGLDVVVAAFADFADGLHAAHTHTTQAGVRLGWCYRTLRPEVLLLTHEGRGVVVDWGLSELVDAHRSRSSAPGGVTGVESISDLQRAALRYFAPEQVYGKPVDGRADVFALGVMLHELTTGDRLFVAESDLGTIERVAKQEAPAPSDLVEGYPPELSALVMRALAKDPAERATAGEMAVGLREVLAARGVTEPAGAVAGFVRGMP
jgi:serine/threonine-protein kinase